MKYKIGINKKKIDIEIGGKTLPVSFVPIYARKMAADLFTGIANLKKIIESDDSEEEKQSSLENILLCREEAIQTILESNGLEYDHDWWERNTDNNDQNEFLQVCLSKDNISGKKKEVSKV